jgi:hypothetical protein
VCLHAMRPTGRAFRVDVVDADRVDPYEADAGIE